MLFIFGRLHMSERARPRRSGTCRVLWVSGSGQKSCGDVPGLDMLTQSAILYNSPSEPWGLALTTSHSLSPLCLLFYFYFLLFHNTTFLKIFLPFYSPLSFLTHFLLCTLKPPYFLSFSFVLLSSTFLQYTFISRSAFVFHFPVIVVVYSKQLWNMLGKRFGLSCIKHLSRFQHQREFLDFVLKMFTNKCKLCH